MKEKREARNNVYAECLAKKHLILNCTTDFLLMWQHSYGLGSLCDPAGTGSSWWWTRCCWESSARRTTGRRCWRSTTVIGTSVWSASPDGRPPSSQPNPTCSPLATTLHRYPLSRGGCNYFLGKKNFSHTDTYVHLLSYFFYRLLNKFIILYHVFR